LKVCSETDDVTEAGKLFHIRAAAMGNTRSPAAVFLGRPVPRSTMTLGVVDLESWQLAEDEYEAGSAQTRGLSSTYQTAKFQCPIPSEKRE